MPRRYRRNAEPSGLERLRQEMQLEWWKACEWEGMSPEEIRTSKFIAFTPDNPYMKSGGRYDRLAKILANTLNNIRHGYRNPNIRSQQYEDFHGNPPSRARKVKVPLPEGPLTAIGKAVRIEYEPYGPSQHKGTRFYHDFGDLGGRKIKERPILASDKRGNIFFVPEHKHYPHFSERGILG